MYKWIPSTTFNMEDIINHICDVYGFVEIPVRIPRNKWQLLKRNLYIWIFSSSNKFRLDLYNFLLKVSPIKCKKKRPDGDRWLL